MVFITIFLCYILLVELQEIPSKQSEKKTEGTTEEFTEKLWRNSWKNSEANPGGTQQKIMEELPKQIWRNFLRNYGWKSPGGIPFVSLKGTRRVHGRNPRKFSWSISRKNFWRKFPELFLEKCLDEIPGKSWRRKSSERFLGESRWTRSSQQYRYWESPEELQEHIP